MARHVFITGGSRGIGRATAEAFLEEGDNVTIMSRNRAQDAYCELRGDHLGKIEIAEGDVSDRYSVTFCVDKARRNYGKIDVLVNCAGIYFGKHGIDPDPDQWDRVISVNLTGSFLVCREVVGDMMKVNQGKIINISSIAGLSYSKSGSVAYTVSKAGVIALTKHLAAAWAPWHINVNCVCPGQTDTDMYQSSLPIDGCDKDMLKNIPMGRVGLPEEQANVIVFLASEAASYINGAIINVSGGQQ